MFEILQWKDPHAVLARRTSSPPPAPATTWPGSRTWPRRHPNVTVMDIPALAISSSDIRRRVRGGEPIRYLVPEGVHTYIEKAGLYRGSG